MTTSNTLRARESYRTTVSRLSAAQKPAASGSPPYSVLVNRRAGRLVAAWAFRRGMTPNTVTAMSAILTFSGIIVIATVRPAWWVGILVWLLLALGYAFDSADGQVARLRGGGSLAGEWLDHVIDCVKITSLHLAVLVTAYLHFDLPYSALLLVPILFAIVGTVEFFAMILNDQLKRVGRSGPTDLAVVRNRHGLIRSILLLPTDYGILCLVFLAMGAPFLFFSIYAALMAATAGHFSLASIKWFRDIRALDVKKPAL